MTNINFYHHGLDIVDLTKNICDRPGSMYTWSEMRFEAAGNARVEQVSEENICVKNNSLTAIIALPQQMSFLEANFTCKRLVKGTIMDLKTADDLEVIRSLGQDGRCLCYWTPYSDEEQEGSFISVNDNQTLPELLTWYPGDPNQGAEANFAAVSGPLDAAPLMLMDAQNSRQCCVVCSFQQETRFRLRGVCKNSFFGNLEFFLEIFSF